jgi:hypothetical protein
MKKRIVIGIMVLLILAAGIYAWSEFNRTVKSLANVKADYNVAAMALIGEFETDEVAAQAKYNNKIVAVNGMVKSIEDVDNSYTVVLGDTSSMSSVRCLIDSTAASAVIGISRGMVINIKGALTGFKKDETGLLGSDVELNRCIVAQASSE